MCQNSSAFLCDKGQDKKWLKTQFINKSLPAQDIYPVRVFVNVTYYYTCNMPHCRGDLEILVAQRISGAEETFTEINLGHIQFRRESSLHVVKQFFFDSNSTYNGFFIQLQSFDDTCVNVVRVLVYRYECPGQDRKPSSGLARRPATQAPDTGSVHVMEFCAENSHFSDISSHNLICQHDGTWLNGQAHCVCDDGYNNDRDADVCEG